MRSPGEPKPYVWWVGRIWITMCTIIGLASLVMFLTPLLTAGVTHSFPDGGTYGPSHGSLTYTLGNTYASIDPNLVNKKYGVYYSVSSSDRGTLRINDVATHELKSAINYFGSEAGAENVIAMAVSDQGDTLYVRFWEYGTLGVYRVTEDGSSVEFENAFSLPWDECTGAFQMYADPDGRSLTMVQGPPVVGISLPQEPGEAVGCRVDAQTGETLNTITWANDIPTTNSLQAWARDPQTGDVYILGGGPQNVLSVVRYGSDTTQTLPRPPLASPSTNPGPGSLIVDGDGLYVTYDIGIYRYSTHDASAPTLVWREPNFLARNPIALVRTTDHLYWWIVEEWTSSKSSATSPFKYSLYSDSFGHKLTSVDGPTFYKASLFDSDHVFFFPSLEGHSLLIGSGETHRTVFSESVLTGYFSSDTMVDPSLPRPLADLWNWWYLGIFVGFTFLRWLSSLGVRRREKRVNTSRQAEWEWKRRRQEGLEKLKQEQAESSSPE